MMEEILDFGRDVWPCVDEEAVESYAVWRYSSNDRGGELLVGPSVCSVGKAAW